MIGSPRSISLARNVEKRHRFWGARALGSWQSIQIAIRLQQSVLEDTGRRVLHVVWIGLTVRSHILVSWPVYPDYEYHYFTMCLVHLWLVEITCHQECISALSPNATHKTVGRPRYSQLQVQLANREIVLPKSMSEFLVIKIYSFGFNILCRTAQNYWLLRTTQATIWVVHWANQDFS